MSELGADSVLRPSEAVFCQKETSDCGFVAWVNWGRTVFNGPLRLFFAKMGHRIADLGHGRTKKLSEWDKVLRI